jgi:hypothetical protein
MFSITKTKQKCFGIGFVNTKLYEKKIFLQRTDYIKEAVQ